MSILLTRPVMRALVINEQNKVVTEAMTMLIVLMLGKYAVLNVVNMDT